MGGDLAVRWRLSGVLESSEFVHMLTKYHVYKRYF